MRAYRRMKWRFHDFKRRLAKGSLDYNRWLVKLEEYNNCCAYCGKPLGDNVTIDHIIPIVRGGTNDIDNLVPCCRHCNSKKCDKTGDEFRKLISVKEGIR